MEVIEDIRILAAHAPLRSVVRDEHLLLSGPPTEAKIKAWQDHPPLEVVHFPQEYREEPLAMPRILFEHDEMRVEWQTMNSRQPFLHRNCDVDEMSYQITGERTLMTELGVVELRPGDFVRIPRGVAHDNYGRLGNHVLFYIPAPVDELAPTVRESEPRFPPFPGHRPLEQPVELVTQCLATAGHDVTAFRADERHMLDQVHETSDRIRVMRADPGQDTTPVYGTDRIRIGMVSTSPGAGCRYRRYLDADELQYQAVGHRTLLTQRGVVDLAPGDFVLVPLGISHTSVTDEPSQHISLLSHRELRQVAAAARMADPYTPERLAAPGDRAAGVAL